jgi:hypothetical protein
LYVDNNLVGVSIRHLTKMGNQALRLFGIQIPT